jgi:hypothetical protein
VLSTAAKSQQQSKAAAAVAKQPVARLFFSFRNTRLSARLFLTAAALCTGIGVPCLALSLFLTPQKEACRSFGADAVVVTCPLSECP